MPPFLETCKTQIYHVASQAWLPHLALKVETNQAQSSQNQFSLKIRGLPSLCSEQQWAGGAHVTTTSYPVSRHETHPSPRVPHSPCLKAKLQYQTVGVIQGQTRTTNAILALLLQSSRHRVSWESWCSSQTLEEKQRPLHTFSCSMRIQDPHKMPSISLAFSSPRACSSQLWIATTGLWS